MTDLRLDAAEAPLLIDLYELTMAASYFRLGMNDRASFSLSVRRMPPRRGFLVAAGLERVLEAIADFHFDQSALDYLDSLQLFEPDFIRFLGGLRFTGELSAMPEGTIGFAEEPIVEVTAPLIEAQLIETMLINQIGMASLIATKAARCTIAARGRRLIDFGLRRSQGADAGLIAARSSYLAGFVGTSNVLAGRRYGIPLFGTMAHSYVMAHDSERAAFEHYTQLFPNLSTLLVDTYDTIRGIENAARVGQYLKQQGHKLQAIRLDSGNLGELSGAARRILDQQGLREVAIVASGNLDEYRIAELVRSGAPIDAFGVGTEMVISGDAPSLDIAYKLSEYGGTPRIKLSSGKATLPGRKQVFRAFSTNGGCYADVIGIEAESAATIARDIKPSANRMESLLEKRISAGRVIGSSPTLAESRQRLLESMALLDDRYKDLEKPQSYPVQYSAALNASIISERARAERRQS